MHYSMNNQRKRMIIWTMMVVIAVALGVAGVIMMTTSTRADDTVKTCTAATGVTGDGTSSWSLGEDCILHVGPGRLGHAVRNDDGMFKPLWGIPEAGKVKSIKLDDPSNTSFPENAAGMFSNIDINGIDGLDAINTTGTKDMSYMFYNSNLGKQYRMESILSFWNVESLETIAHMYDGYKGPLSLYSTGIMDSLTDASYLYANYKGDYLEVDFNDFDMHNIKNASHMFYNSKFDMLNGFSEKQYPYYSTLEDTSYMFSKTDTNFNTIGLFGLGMDNVKNATHMFDGARILLDVRDFNMRSAEDISYMFSNIDYEYGIDISYWNCPELTNMKGLFAGSSVEGVSIVDVSLPKVEEMSIGYPSDPPAGAKPTVIGDMGIELNETEIGGSSTALENLLNGVQVNDLDDFGQFESTTPKDTIGIKNTTVKSDQLSFPELNMDNINGITLKGDRSGDADTRGSGQFNKVTLDKDYHHPIKISIDDVPTKTLDLSGPTASNDSDINLTYGLEKLVLRDGTHVTSAPKPVATEPNVARWIRTDGNSADGYDWASKIRTSGRDLVRKTADDHAGGTYVGQLAHGVEFDKNTTEELAGGSVPEPIEDKYPSDIQLGGDGMRIDGYKFNGWNTMPDGSGTTYQAGSMFSKPGMNTLYAMWESTLNNKLEFDANGGHGNVPATVKNSRTATIDCNHAPVKDKATFIGWSKTKSGLLSGSKAGEEGQVIACGTSSNDTITIPDGDMKLYAVWAANPRLIRDTNKPSDMTGLLPESEPITGSWWVNGRNSKTIIGRDFKGWFKGMSPDGRYQFNGWLNEDGASFDGVELDYDDVTIKADWTKVSQAIPTPTVPDSNDEPVIRPDNPSTDVVQVDPVVNDGEVITPAGKHDETPSPSTTVDETAMNVDEPGDSSDPDGQGVGMASTGATGMPVLLIITVLAFMASGTLAIVRSKSIR